MKDPLDDIIEDLRDKICQLVWGSEIVDNAAIPYEELSPKEEEKVSEIMALIEKDKSALKAEYEEKVRQARVDELNLVKQNSQESYLGSDWWADENIKDHSAHEVPLSYISDRLAELNTPKNGEQ